MFRRNILSATALLPVLAVIGCSASGSTPSQISSDVNLIASGLAATIAQIKQIPTVPVSTLNQLNADLLRIQADAAQIAAAPATSTVQAIGQVVQDVAAIALPLVPGGSAIETTVQAALSLLPAILTAAGVAGASRPGKFTPAQARLILAATH